MKSDHIRMWVGVTATLVLTLNLVVLSAMATTQTDDRVATFASSTSVTQAAEQAVATTPVATADAVAETATAGTYLASASAELAVIGRLIAPSYTADAATELAAIEQLAAEAAQAAQAAQAAAEAAAAEAAAEAAAKAAAAEAAAKAASQAAATEVARSEPAPKAAPAPQPAVDRAGRAMKVADSLPFDWRAHGITFRIGCHPDTPRCSWGVFDYRVDEVWLSSDAFASHSRLQYVVAHELAHAWQWSTDDLDARKADLVDFGVSTSNGIEYAADCIAAAWGHAISIKWNCPSDAVAHMRSVFAANR